MKAEIKLAIVLLTITTVLSETDYCALRSCPNSSHTLCRFYHSSPAGRCGQFVLTNSRSKRELNEIYNEVIRLKEIEHQWREVLNPGSVKNYELTLEWDKELTNAARIWARQCMNKIDQCRNVERFSVDQRVTVAKSVDGVLNPSLTTIIQNWYHEDPRTLIPRNYSANNRSLWESVTKIGCGSATIYDEADPTSYVYFVCNFAPVDYTVPFDPNYIF